MSTTKNMASDYLWVRPAPIEQKFTYKNHGQYYIYETAPNKFERL
jgi:hypothetical protein